MTKLEVNFVRESNAIEGVFDEDSVQQALVAWDYLKLQKEMTPDVILKTHKLLMLNQPLMPNEKGYFRTVPVYIGGKEAIDSRLISNEIKVWCELVNSFPKEWKKHHIWYERIHPFVDGNGRTGRMFMNWERYKLGIGLLIIKASQRHRYYGWFA